MSLAFSMKTKARVAEGGVVIIFFRERNHITYVRFGIPVIKGLPVSGGANKQLVLLTYVFEMDGVHLQCNYRHLLYVYKFCSNKER